MPTNLSLWRGIIGRAPRGPVIEICVRHKETHRFPIDSPQNTMWCVILMLQRTGTYWSFMCFAILHNSFPYKLKWPVSLYAHINPDLIKPISVSLSYNITFFCNDNIHRQKDSMQKKRKKRQSIVRSPKNTRAPASSRVRVWPEETSLLCLVLQKTNNESKITAAVRCVI